MAKEYWKVEWGNGNTDVFADIEDARECYKNDPEEALNWATTGGEWTETPATEAQGAVWSDRAKAK